MWVREALSDIRVQAERYPAQLSLFNVNAFRAALDRALPRPASEFAPPDIHEVAPEAPRPTAEWTYATAFARRGRAIHGLPGAFADRGTVRWRPPHAGRHEAAIVAYDAAGFATRHFEIVAEW